MQELTLDPSDATVVADRRYRRSANTSEALAFQCAHIQSGLELDALIVSDDVGDRWVGAGDRALCRFLSRNAPALAAGESNAAMKLRALQTISEGLESGHVTTARVKLPERDKFLFITGVGNNVMRTHGVSTTAHGSKRILGYIQPAMGEDADATETLQDLVDGAFSRLDGGAGTLGNDPSSFLGFFDDRVYRDTLSHILTPAMNAIARAGLVTDDLWRNYRLRSRESKIEWGLYERCFRVPVREQRSGVRLGELEVRFFHRHDIFEISRAPLVKIKWRA